MAVLDHYVQGSFTADGNAHILNIPSGVDFIEVENLTRIITPQNGTGVKFRWMNGFAANSAIQEITNGAGVMTINQITTNGFQLISGVPAFGTQLSGTAISGATPPVVSSANTGSLANGNIVLIYNAVGAHEFDGMEFTVGSVVANTSFALPYAPTISAGTTLNYRFRILQSSFYPRRLFITAITAANPCVVTLSVTHNLTVGQRVVFSTVPSMYGMTQISNLRGLITAINTTNNTVTLNIDSSAFTAFAFPTSAVAAATAHTQPQLIPFGDGPSSVSNPLGNQDVLDGATYNTSVNGMLLGAGANGPAGQNNDVIYWRAWKAEQVQTTYAF